MDRKEEIILATLDLASKNGLQSVTMSQIAEKLGIKKPSLYNHFKSKEDIVATSFAMTIHAMLDYKFDCITSN